MDYRTSDKSYKKLKDFLKKSRFGDRILACLNCGECTSNCPVAIIDQSYRPSRISYYILNLKDELINEDLIWKCAFCYKCLEYCPKNVKFTDIILELRNYFTSCGHLFQPYIQFVKKIYENGFSLEIPEFILEEREDYDLPPIKHSEHALLELQSIFKKTGLFECIYSKESDSNQP